MPTVTPPAITALPTPPDPNNRATFNTLAYPWSVAQGVLATQVGAVATNVKANADDAATSTTTATTKAAAAVVSADSAYANALITNADRSQTALDRIAAAASAVQASKLNLGNKTSAPTLDNQGAALLAGATYYDTTLNKWRVWSGTAWVDGLSAVAGVSTINGVSGAVVNIATTGANTFTAAQNHATGAAIASAATINLDTVTGNRIHITGVATITVLTLTHGPRTVIFDGALTLTHNATTNNLPGAANITTAAGDRAIYESDGTTVYCVSYIRANGVGVANAGDNFHTVHTGNGFGSTNTKIRRFTTTLGSAGAAITYSDSATLGASFTINEAGIYAIQVQDVLTAFESLGISLNTTQPTITIANAVINASSRLISAANGGNAGIQIAATTIIRLAVSDVIRHHGDGASTSTSNLVFFSIRKVGV